MFIYIIYVYTHNLMIFSLTLNSSLSMIQINIESTILGVPRSAATQLGPGNYGGAPVC